MEPTSPARSAASAVGEVLGPIGGGGRSRKLSSGARAHQAIHFDPRGPSSAHGLPVPSRLGAPRVPFFQQQQQQQQQQPPPPRSAMGSPPRHVALNVDTGVGSPPPQTSSTPSSSFTSTSSSSSSARPTAVRVLGQQRPFGLDPAATITKSSPSAASPAASSAQEAVGGGAAVDTGAGRVRRRRSSATTSPHHAPGLSMAESATARRQSPFVPGRVQSPTRRAAPPPPTSLMSSVFMRRAAGTKAPPSSSTMDSEYGPRPREVVAPAVLFFQDSDSETSSQRGGSYGAGGGGDAGRANCHASDEQRDTTDSSSGPSHDDHDPDSRKPARGHRRPPLPSTPHPHVEKLGELSREGDEYDFAILFKPSKFEEHLRGEDHIGHEPSTTTALVGEDPTRPSVLGRSSSLVGPVAAPQQQQPLTTFKLPTTPRSQLRKQRKDPTAARAAIIQRITRTGLQVKRLLSLDGRQTLLKVKAPQHVLELGAERMRLRKLRRFDRIWMEFSCELRETFEDFDPARGGVRFLDSEKQCIVHSLLTSDASHGAGAGLNEFCPLKTKHVLKMFPLHKQDLAALRRHWVTYWREDEAPRATGDGAASLPSSSSSCLAIRGRRLRRVLTHALEQPIDEVAQYYGERVAYYFAWLEMYTRWLVVPAVGGTLLFLLQLQSNSLDHPLASAYAIFMAVWTSAFLLAWKRRAATLAYRWGTLGYEDAEITRPEFYGDPALSTETTKRYPAWRRYAKYLVTLPSVLGSIVLVLLLTFYAFTTRDRLEQESIEVKAKATGLAKDMARDLEHGLTLDNLKRLTALGMDWDFWFYFLITPILYGLLIPVLDYAFTRFARAITNWENHRTETHYQSHLILKVFSFRFVHVFSSLYYYAFATPRSRGDGLLRVAVQLASFMVTDQLWRNAMQTLYPFVMRHFQVQRKKKATNAQFQQSTVFNHPIRGHRPHHGALGGGGGGGGSSGSGSGSGSGTAAGAARKATHNNAIIHEQCVRLEQASDKAWEEAELEQYDTFEDYTEMLIQFGCVTFFSLAFPLAPLLALLNNVAELRMDAFKLCHAKQRPIAQKASGIGIWFQVLQLMSVLAVLTNCLHIAFTTTQLERLFPSLTASDKVWIVFVVEHVILALKVWMMLIIPSMPAEVKAKVRQEREHAKIESARAMALKIQSQQQQQREEQGREQEDKPREAATVEIITTTATDAVRPELPSATTSTAGDNHDHQERGPGENWS